MAAEKWGEVEIAPPFSLLRDAIREFGGRVLMRLRGGAFQYMNGGINYLNQSTLARIFRRCSKGFHCF